jgi:hypothetical protein
MERVDISGLSRSHENQAKSACRSALDALNKEVIPLPPQLVEAKGLSNLVSSSATLLKHAVKLSDLKEIPNLAKEAYEWFQETSDFEASEDKNAFVEIHHHIGWDLWSSPLGNDKKIDLETLFGNFKKEGKPVVGPPGG